MSWIENLGTSLGLSFQPAKTIHPTTCIEFLGLELDSEAMEARLPQDIVSVLSSGTIQNAQVMNMLRWIVMLAACMGFTYSSSWLASVDNSLTDAASCFKYGCLF